ncbi:MAG: hypothetical protein JXJ04_06560 [Spirochaetales bacterium]|nr:hypothetical protein [Spirochaetales bacterium]
MKENVSLMSRLPYLALAAALLIYLATLGCTLGGIESGTPSVIEEEHAVPLAVIDLGTAGSIEFVETSPGELLVGAMFNSPETELIGIDESPLAVYRYYTGEEPPAGLIAAYERSQAAQPRDGIVSRPESKTTDHMDPQGVTRLSASEFTSTYFSSSYINAMSYKANYPGRTGLFRTQQNCFTLGLVVNPYRGSVRANLKTLYASTWSTEYTRLVSQESVYRAYTGGVWRTRIAEVVESDGDGFHVMYYGMNITFVCVSLGGSSSTDIHPVVSGAAANEGITLNTLNWKKSSGDGVCSSSDAADLKDLLATWSGLNSPPRGNLNLLVVGKSAGGVLAWNTFKRHWGTIDDFHKVAMVLVDPHGSVTDDGNVGPYCDSQSLWWPSNWSTNKSYFRVYNIYQHTSGLTGASFPSSNVYKNIKLSGDVSHDSIPGKEDTKLLIREAVRFVKP